MKIAIPLFGTRISPYFDYAPKALVLVIDNGKVTDSYEVSFENWNIMERINYLESLGVDTVICGGISNTVQNFFSGKKIHVIPWITGEAKEALQIFLEGNLDPGTILCPGRKRMRWRFCKASGRGRRGGGKGL